MDFVDLLKIIIVVPVIIIGLGLSSFRIFWYLRYIFTGRNDERTSLENLPKRFGGFIRFVLGQARVIRELGGFFHFFVFWGFLILQAETIEFIVRTFHDDFRMSYLIGEQAYNGLMFIQDIFGLLVFLAVVGLIIRRFVVRPEHVIVNLDSAIVLGFEFFLMVTKFLAHGAEIAHATPENLGWDVNATPVSAAASYVLSGGGGPFSTHTGWMEALFIIGYIGHLALIFWFATYLPNSKQIHVVGAMPNIFFKRFEPLGALYPDHKVAAQMDGTADEDDEDAYIFGVSKMEDLTWKQMLDTYACTQCARCEHYCPAFNTGKELNPMMLIQKLKHHIQEKGKQVYRKKGEDDFPLLPGGIISNQELMACTTCGACVANCPVFIEHVDTIVDLRRYLAMVDAEKSLSPELGRTFKNIENASNPWGVSNSKRADWAEGLNVPVMADLEEAPEYLFWIGCAGAFDDRQKKVTRDMIKILETANVSYAILGTEEKCTGDAARRLGNEYLYWMQATANIETLNQYNITKIITTCPHCMHTLDKEYPQLGGNYEVIHHAEFLNNLIKEGRLPLKAVPKANYIYHDSCYIGRWNQDYDNPREALLQVPGAKIQEMSWNKRQALCCGAGGGQMWMEEDQGKRINLHRADMAIEAGGDAVVVNCPFCMTMISDGLSARDANIPSYDLAEVIANALNVISPIEKDAKPNS